MKVHSDPEIIPADAPWPRPIPSTGLLSDAALDQLASVLDDGFRVPGTKLSFGLDPIIGLIPGIGDAISGFASLLLVIAGWRRGLPKITLSRMVANIAIDSVCGSLPILGDVFDVYWKANRKNFNLLQRHALQPYHPHTWRDWLFLWGVLVILVALGLLPLVVLAGAVYLLRK